MSTTGLEVFDKTLQTTHIWLDEVMDITGPDRHVAWHVLGAVLRSLRDRLPPELGAHLAAQLPLLVRGAYYDQYRPGQTPTRIYSEDEFLASVTAQLGGTRPVNVRDAARSVFAVLDRHVTPEQIAKVTQSLPPHIRALWIGGGETG